jgi:hypothetical protein
MSAFGGGADIRRTAQKSPLIAESVEKVLRGVRGERLIRQQTEQRNNDSNIVLPNFDCCGNTILELCSPTFSTPSANNGHKAEG